MLIVRWESAMEVDIAEGDMKPPAVEDEGKTEVQVDCCSPEAMPLAGKLEKMVSKGDSFQEKDLQSVDEETSVCPKEPDKNSTGPKPIPVVTKEKTTDGYNWRKYGQKQVKNPEGSRSYYRCTFSNCSAKKIERYDPFNCITDVVYKSLHSHDPPQRVNFGADLSPAPNVPVNGGDHITRPVGNFKDPLPKNNETIETKRDSLCSDETMNSKTEEVDGPKDERRLKKSPESEMASRPENAKRPKMIVCEAIDDASKSNDGYRWRKYGQKTVKGTPHPRNYYKCTSAGCPVRKHVEKATDNMGSVIITYKGVHDHDLPLPKKRPESKSPPLLSAATPVSNNKLQINKREQNLGQTQQSAEEKERPEH